MLRCHLQLLCKSQVNLRLVRTAFSFPTPSLVFFLASRLTSKCCWWLMFVSVCLLFVFYADAKHAVLLAGRVYCIKDSIHVSTRSLSRTYSHDQTLGGSFQFRSWFLFTSFHKDARTKMIQNVPEKLGLLTAHSKFMDLLRPFWDHGIIWHPCCGQSIHCKT